MRKILLCLAMVWMFKSFNTIDEAIKFMNTLPENAQPQLLTRNTYQCINERFSVVYKG